MQTKSFLRTLLLGVIGLTAISSIFGYVLLTDESGIYVIKWQRSLVAMQIKLPTVAGLSDGSSMSSSVAAAIPAWNTRTGTVQLQVTELGPGPYALGNGVNEIAVDSTIEGQAFGSGTLAITISYRDGNARTESDIIFNSATRWDSYRGDLRPAVYDVRRVATHELGHVLGLQHPDEHGQNVPALMNSVVSSIYSLQNDDVAGAYRLYGNPGYVPANDNFADAVALTLVNSTGQWTGSNIAATSEPGEPSHAGLTGGHSVWWKWTAPSSANTSATTLGSDFDTTLAVYTGSSVSALTLISANDDAETAADNPTPTRKRTSAVTFSAVGGTTYYLAVDGWSNVANGLSGYTGRGALNLIFEGGIPPNFTSQPSDRSGNAGQATQFNVEPTGGPTPVLQWQRLPADGNSWINLGNDGNYSGTTSDTLTVIAPTMGMSGDQFRCVATNSSASVTSNAATLTVIAVALPNVSGVAFRRNTVYSALEVNILGQGPLRLQWYHDGLPMVGNLGTSIPAYDPAGTELGEYYATVSNGGGTVASRTATLDLTDYIIPAPDYYWLRAMEVDGIIYFLFKSPAQIRRYDLSREVWLNPWPLSQVPTDFVIATDAIFVATGNDVVRYDRNLGSATTLITGTSAIKSLSQTGNQLVTAAYESPNEILTSYDRFTGQKLDTRKEVVLLTRGLNYQAATGRLYGISNRDGLGYCVVEADGKIGPMVGGDQDSRFSLSQNVVILSDNQVASENGAVVNATDLTLASGLGGRISDIIPSGSSGYYVLRNGRVSATDPLFRETGAVTRTLRATRLWLKEGKLFLFEQPAAAGAVPAVDQVETGIVQPTPLPAPSGPEPNKVWSPQVLVDESGVAYIYSKIDRTIYRWSSQTMAYLPSIPLANNPDFLTYSAETRSIYFDDRSYQIRRLALDGPTFVPLPVGVSMWNPANLESAGAFLFVSSRTPSGSPVSLETFTDSGTISRYPWPDTFPLKAAWCPANRRVYCLTTGYPTRLYYHPIGVDGQILPAVSASQLAAGGESFIRVSSDGTLVALGSGSIYDGQSLSKIGNVANAFQDGLWMGGHLQTVRQSGNSAEVQSWSAQDFRLQRDRLFSGVPVGLLPLPGGRLLLVTSTEGVLVIRVLDAGDLRIISSSAPTFRSEQTISFDTLLDKVYGQAPFPIAASSSSGLPVSFTVTSGPATISGNTMTLTSAGTVTIRASQTGDASYSSASNPTQSFTVGKAQLAVSADNKTKSYGAANPTLTLSYSGFIGSDGPNSLTTAPSAKTTVSSYWAVGSYAITVTGGTAANYIFSYIGGTLTVAPAPLTVKANDVVRLYGVENPPLTISYSGFVNGESSTVLLAKPVANTTAVLSSPLGVYPITLTGGGAENYALTLVNGKLTVAPPNYAGTYFGTFTSGGSWAFSVRTDNTATYIGYLPARHSAAVLKFNVAADGGFSAAGTEIKSANATNVGMLAMASSEFAGHGITAAAAGDFTLSGQISVDGTVTGEIVNFAETLAGAIDPATGPAQSSTGLYTAYALGDAGGVTYAIIGASGQTVVVTTTPGAVDGAAGMISASGQFSATTGYNAQLLFSVDASAQTASATVTPAGTTTPIVFIGMSDTATSSAYLANLSVRAATAVGQTLIVGFVVDGGAKPILVRAAGPALNRYGLTGVADPNLTLYNGSTVVTANDNWETALAPTFATLGAFPFDAASNDAALLQSINGPHTAQATATGAGAILVETYDAGPNDGRKLVNLSTRFRVGTGDNILIAGFVLAGAGPRQLLIRAVGPTLATYGVTGTLVDPQLAIYDGGTSIASNDNWSSSLTPTFDLVGAFHLLDASKDAAIVVTLQAGKAYTVQVSGVGATTGEALVEIYAISSP